MHAAEAGVAIEWVEGDAEALPFADASFDRVLSTFGVMFAPRHEEAAAELARVCMPGGLIGIACWRPYGLIGDMFKLVASRMPPLPSYAKSPILWGDEEHVRSLLEPHGLELTFEPQVAIFRGESAERVVQQKETYFGPWRMAQSALGDEWTGVRSQLVDLYTEHFRADDAGEVGAFGEYLVTLARKPA
jgi:SAM-dependent methyltransferase